ncbi:hypothetical protein E3E12_05055 [Formicincola oecophyllae]|uniref:Uncharacterized protein n=1 Tax=Formicincola oecophyllae TaxID=2558361 RepID=A0A4Y6UB87_9PROT|nr:hypothetical protein [Formicincola oecophyllae]QDH13661.1 hypothetical protein E3E12_05055 [Formicincola oecophyllae]
MGNDWLRRGWWAILLFILTGGIIGLGVWHEAQQALAEAVGNFKAALPPGTKFTYASIRPSFLVRGVTLHGVTLARGTERFQTESIRLGHPVFQPDGALTFSSLLFRDARYDDGPLHAKAGRILFSHLYLPPIYARHSRRHLNRAGLRGLAAVLAFTPEQLTRMRFRRLRLRRAAVSMDTPLALVGQGLTLKSAQARLAILEGYGKGNRLFAEIQDATATYHLDPRRLLNLYMPAGTLAAQVPGRAHEWRLTLSSLYAREGSLQLFSHPFQRDSDIVARFWQAPILTLWEDPGNFSATNLKLQLLSDNTTPTLTANADAQPVSIGNISFVRHIPTTTVRAVETSAESNEIPLGQNIEATSAGDVSGLVWPIFESSKQPPQGHLATNAKAELTPKGWKGTLALQFQDSNGQLDLETGYVMPPVRSYLPTLRNTLQLTPTIPVSASEVFKAIGQSLLHTRLLDPEVRIEGHNLIPALLKGLGLLPESNTPEEAQMATEQLVSAAAQQHDQFQTAQTWLLSDQPDVLRLTFGNINLKNFENAPVSDGMAAFMHALKLSTVHMSSGTGTADKESGHGEAPLARSIPDLKP